MKTQLSGFFQSITAPGLLLLALLTPTRASAQARNLYDWTWVSRLGATTLAGQSGSSVPPSFTYPESLAADAAGNVIVAGLYDPDVIFDSPAIRYQTTVGASGSRRNSYVAKYTSSGALAWSRDLTSNGEVHVRDVAVDAAGNSYVLGRYYQQLYIGSAIATLASTLNAHFLAKLSPNGVLVWAVTIEPDAQIATRFQMERLAVDAAGNSVVQGQFEGQVTINGVTFAGTANKLHALVLRYGAVGTFQNAWAGYTTAGAEIDRGFTGVALASTGDVYLSGYVNPAATLQFGTLPAVMGPTVGNATGFIVKFTAASASWVVKTTGTGSQSTEAIGVGPQDKCYVLGGLSGSNMSLGTQSLNTGNPAGASGKDIFLARIASNGSVESLVGGGGTNKVGGLALGPLGEATISTAGGLSWGNVQLPGAPWPSSFLAGLVQLDAAGVPQRGWQTGVSFSTASDLAVDGFNRPVLAGTYGGASPFTFGTLQRTTPYAWNTLIARTATTVLATRQAAAVAGLEVYPNPARQWVEVHTAKAGATQIQLLDALGRSIRTQTLTDGQHRVALTGLAPGCYTLRVQQGEARSFRRVTVDL